MKAAYQWASTRLHVVCFFTAKAGGEPHHAKRVQTLVLHPAPVPHKQAQSE